MESTQHLRYQSELTATVVRANGTREYIGALKPRMWHRFICWILGRECLAIVLSAIAILFGHHVAQFICLGLVTTTGVNYMASDFASGGVTPTISGFKFHACGTGVTAAAVGDTALQTDSGVARVSGTASNPSANVYKSVATMAFVSTLAITEWGLFSALTVGTMWDHRVFSAINVNTGDSIQFSYSLTIASGGS